MKLFLVLALYFMVAGPCLANWQDDLVTNVLIAEQTQLNVTTGYQFILYQESETGLGGTFKVCTLFKTVDILGGGMAFNNASGYAGSNWILGPAISTNTIESWFSGTSLNTTITQALKNYLNMDTGISTMPVDWSKLNGDWGVTVYMTAKLF